MKSPPDRMINEKQKQLISEVEELIIILLKNRNFIKLLFLHIKERMFRNTRN
jgi:hypothetical protein